jgi:hypothetical protein
MTFEKFSSEIDTLKKFFSIYCHDKHKEQFEKEYELTYQNKKLTFSISLCSKCHEMLNYSIERLKECPHNPKPRCRSCSNPCYEKSKYKQMAKMMRYAGFKLGLTKAAKRLKSLFE